MSVELKQSGGGTFSAGLGGRWIMLACVGALLGGHAVCSSAQAPAPPSAANSAARSVVVLDAAHGGSEVGGRLTTPDGSGFDEKAFTLALGQRLRSLLQARGFTVITTRDSDATVGADHRAEVANRARAVACLSLHATSSGSGVHLYTSSLQPVSEPGRFVAWKTAQAGFVTRSLSLAGVLNSALTNGGLTVSLGRTALPGMDSMSCPAVAVEVAPTPGKDKPGRLDDADYQARVATAVAAALVQWRSEGSQP